jgi:hypothetical protein
MEKFGRTGVVVAGDDVTYSDDVTVVVVEGTVVKFDWNWDADPSNVPNFLELCDRKL